MDKIDPIVLNEIDECNEWLVGQVDDNNNEEEGNGLVFMMISILIGQIFMKLQRLENQ